MGKPHIICEICKDDGKCLNNEKHKHYEKNNQNFFGTDYLDCVDYLETKNNTRGEFIKGYVKKLQEEREIYRNQKWNDEDRVKFEYGL
jgi:hypothetical protein